ncbi:MAG: hypothetical protein DDT27_00093 [Dehalococcoidia bacterium]|nr:hypothetical protein [Chloroflexota bacterium]
MSFPKARSCCHLGMVRSSATQDDRFSQEEGRSGTAKQIVHHRQGDEDCTIRRDPFPEGNDRRLCFRKLGIGIHFHDTNDLERLTFDLDRCAGCCFQCVGNNVTDDGLALISGD